MKRKKLGEILQERGLVDKSDLLSALYEVGQAPSFRFCPHCGMQRDRRCAGSG